MIELEAFIHIAQIGETTSNVPLNITPEPETLIKQLNAFCIQVGTRIEKEILQDMALTQKNVALTEEIEYRVAVRIFCDGSILDCHKDISLTLTRNLNRDLEREIYDIKEDMVLKLSREILCLSKFRQQKVLRPRKSTQGTSKPY